MAKTDFKGQVLRANDWIKFNYLGHDAVGRVLETEVVHNNDFSNPQILRDDIKVLYGKDQHLVRSAFYVEKISPELAMLMVLESQ